MGMNLLAYIKRIDEGTTDFRKFPTRVRYQIVGFLRSEGMLVEEICARLGIKPSTTYYYLSKYHSDLVKQAREHSGKWIGRLIAKAEHLYKSAKTAGKLELCWKIEVDLINKLIDMEIIHVRERPSNVSININMDRERLEKDLRHDLSLLEMIKQDGRFSVETGPAGGDNGDAAGPRLPEAPPQCGEQGEGEGVPGGEE